MSEIICITNRHLVSENFLDRIEKTAFAKPSAIILREKDMFEEEYAEIAEKVLRICERYSVTCILHSFVNAAKNLGCKRIHLPLSILREMSENNKKYFTVIGASCHSVAEAVFAEQSGCAYITAGHIFPTDCKKDLFPRGLDFLREICSCVSIPVYAVGGINVHNFKDVISTGCEGGCMMSEFMKCENPKKIVNAVKKC